jgi:hypothetical protein
MHKMKRSIKIVAVLMLLLFLATACNHYVCPAYSKDTAKEQPSDSEQG